MNPCLSLLLVLVMGPPANVDRVGVRAPNNFLPGLGGYLRHCGLEPVAIQRVLMAAKEAVCDQPLGHGEVEDIPNGMARYPTRGTPAFSPLRHTITERVASAQARRHQQAANASGVPHRSTIA